MFRFKDFVYERPYTPYYDKYKGHVFAIDHFMPEDELLQHVWLRCVTDETVKVMGYVELFQLELLK